MSSESALLEVSHLSCTYRPSGILGLRGRRHLPDIVREVSFEVSSGSTVALVGESGSGKTTIARVVAGMLTPHTGHVHYNGEPLPGSVASRSVALRREIQYVFQNPAASLNPRQRVGDIVGRPAQLFLGLGRREREDRVTRLLEDVRLDPGFARRFPSELSGGEQQRVAIARALAADPRLVLCDEILTALDVSVQKRILELLRALQLEHGLTYLFISHDLGVVRSIADHVVVLYRGEVMESGPPDVLRTNPQHPYTQLLVESVPRPGTRVRPAEPGMTGLFEAGPPPAPGDGCPFAPRCGRRIDGVCDSQRPPTVKTGVDALARCHAVATDRLAG